MKKRRVLEVEPELRVAYCASRRAEATTEAALVALAFAAREQLKDRPGFSGERQQEAIDRIRKKAGLPVKGAR